MFKQHFILFWLTQHLKAHFPPNLNLLRVKRNTVQKMQLRGRADGGKGARGLFSAPGYFFSAQLSMRVAECASVCLSKAGFVG